MRIKKIYLVPNEEKNWKTRVDEAYENWASYLGDMIYINYWEHNGMVEFSLLHLSCNVLYIFDWLGKVFSFKQTSIFFLVEFQFSRTSNTPNRHAFKATNVLTSIVYIGNVSSECRSSQWTFVWTFKCGSWYKLACSDTFILIWVQTLVAFFTELQIEWPASLTKGFSVDALQEVAFVDFFRCWISVFEITVSFSLT